MDPSRFESQLHEAISPAGGVSTLYTAVSRLASSAIPLVAMDPYSPMKAGPDGVSVGVYWSRSLATAVAIGLAAADSRLPGGKDPALHLEPILSTDTAPDLIEHVKERNVLGWLWELPGVARDMFAG